MIASSPKLRQLCKLELGNIVLCFPREDFYGRHYRFHKINWIKPSMVFKMRVTRTPACPTHSPLLPLIHRGDSCGGNTSALVGDESLDPVFWLKLACIWPASLDNTDVPSPLPPCRRVSFLIDALKFTRSVKGTTAYRVRSRGTD